VYTRFDPPVKHRGLPEFATRQNTRIDLLWGRDHCLRLIHKVRFSLV
jgi:hypothetical protein